MEWFLYDVMYIMIYLWYNYNTVCLGYKCMKGTSVCCVIL